MSLRTVLTRVAITTAAGALLSSAAVMPALAGTARMPYPRFLAFNAAGGLFWGVERRDALASNGPRHSFICPTARRANRLAAAAYGERRPVHAR